MTVQRSFEDLGTPLAKITFCVVDLETTGGSAADGAITEIGALKVRRGEAQGTFQTLIDPRIPVAPFVRRLTGLCDEQLRGAPTIDGVLPSFLEFARGSVLVAHNARFDLGFLNAALARADRPPLDQRVIDTALLARRLLQGEVPDHRLATLARHLGCAHQPAHRAFADVLATSDVLHHLIERCAGYGVTTLEDLLSMSAAKMQGTFNKIVLTKDLPRAGGIYRFLGPNGNTLYVGKAADIRSRVRSYFYGDPRRRIGDLLRELQAIEAEIHPTMLEAEIAETRAISNELPPYNRRGKGRPRWYVKLALRERAPRLLQTRVKKPDRALYLGPFSAKRQTTVLIDALRSATRIHRCPEPRRCSGCAYSELGTCSGTDPAEHRRQARLVGAALAGDHRQVLDALVARMARLAAEDRFEEAAEMRNAAASLARALERSARARELRDAGDVVLRTKERLILVRDGRLAATGDAAEGIEPLRTAAPEDSIASDDADAEREARVILRWIASDDEVRIVSTQRTWASAAAGAPCGRFVPRGAPHDPER